MLCIRLDGRTDGRTNDEIGGTQGCISRQLAMKQKYPTYEMIILTQNLTQNITLGRPGYPLPLLVGPWLYHGLNQGPHPHFMAIGDRASTTVIAHEV